MFWLKQNEKLLIKQKGMIRGTVIKISKNLHLEVILELESNKKKAY